MEQPNTQHPLLELAAAISELSAAMDDIDRYEQAVKTAQDKLEAAMALTKQAFGPAYAEAMKLGHVIPHTYQHCDTLIRIHAETHNINVERITVGCAYDLKYLVVEATKEASS